MKRYHNLIFLSMFLVVLHGCDIKSKQEVNERLLNIEQENKQIVSRLSELEGTIEQIKLIPSSSYLRVTNPTLNIRSKPSTSGSIIIAVAHEGGYLKKLNCSKSKANNCLWYKIEFWIDNYPFTGFVAANYVEEELIDDVTFTRISKQSNIKIMWLSEIIRTVKKNKIGTIGVSVTSDKSHNSDLLQFKLNHRLIRNRINVKPLQYFDESKAKQICLDYKVEGILYIETKETGIFTISLYDYNGFLKYTNALSFNSVELNQN